MISRRTLLLAGLFAACTWALCIWSLWRVFYR